MAVSNVTASLTGGVIQVINGADSSVRVNNAIGSLALGASASQYYDYYPILTGGGSALPIALATVYFAYIKNIGGSNGSPSGNITVIARASGGALPAAADSPVLSPGGVWLYACTSETAGGIISMTLVATVANTPVEILVAA